MNSETILSGTTTPPAGTVDGLSARPEGAAAGERDASLQNRDHVVAEDALELIFQLHQRDGVLPVGKMPGLWERRLDDRWTFWINGQLEPVRTPTDFNLRPGECYVEFNGWPAGILSMITGEGYIAAGSLANYQTFCEALRRAIAEPQ